MSDKSRKLERSPKTEETIPREVSLGKIEGPITFILRFERFLWDGLGILTLTIAILTFLGLVGFTRGTLLNLWVNFLRRWFGWGSAIFVLLLVILGLIMLKRRMGLTPQIYWGRVFALEAAAFSALVVLSAIGENALDQAENGLYGGLIGWSLAKLVGMVLTPFLTVSLAAFMLIMGLLIGSGLWDGIVKWAEKRLQLAASAGRISLDTTEAPDLGPAVSLAPVSGAGSVDDAPAAKRKILSRLPSEFRKNFRIQDKDERPAQPRQRDERLPGFDLLIDERANKPDERHINLTAGLIEKTLADFGIPAKVVGFQVGPTVTQFAVEPGYVEKSEQDDDQVRQKVRVSQISALSKDLSLALSASRLRIEAPVPGRPYIGVEIPNTRSTVVRLRPILETEAFQKLDSPLGIALGRDVSGKAVAMDLARMPHLLIAGTTGSGKSVCIAAMTMCLVMNNTPEDMRLVMIDPKMVELVRFNGLPHLYGKVETDLQRILGVLRWTVSEMDRRYKLLEESRSRHIDSHNRKAQRRRGMETLPRIVVLIDELADLMMAAPEQTEPSLVRLAQLARATGIHLVVATQRPSTEVVTGLIKANFPARLSFAVASSIDSRVILDTQGADALLGRGDMLFLPPDAPSPIRAQGVIVTDQEIEKVINFWQKQSGQELESEPPWESMLLEDEMLADRDDLIRQAIKIVQESQRASTSMLQRRLRIGYPRAARLMDELEELGVVGPSQGGGREREVLVDENDEEGD